MWSVLALVAATLALQASAFLIPPHIHDTAVATEATWEGLLSTVEYAKELDCPGCPFAGSDENDSVWELGVNNKIALTFNVDDSQRLNINEIPVYPFDLSPPFTPRALVAQQVRVSDGSRSAPIPLGHALEIFQEFQPEKEPETSVIGAKFTILDLNGRPVKVDTVKLTLLQRQTETGTKLHLLGLETIPFEQTPGSDSCEGQAKWSLCRLRAIIQARVSQLVAAAKSHAQAAHKWIKVPGKGCHGGTRGKHGAQKPHHRHHGHGLHRLMHRFGRMLHRVIRFFVVPALLGVIGGLIASAIGMLVGQLIVYLWIRFRRNGERGPVRHGEVILEVDEKDGLLDVEGDIPPAYEDATVVMYKDDKE